MTTGNVMTTNTQVPLQITNQPIGPIAEKSLNEIVQTVEGVKDDKTKLYYEVDWEFIEGMAKTMSNNKTIYPKWNWQKPMPDGVDRLKQSLIRHTMEILKGNYKDGDEELGHLYSIALNAMMLTYQLKHHGK